MLLYYFYNNVSKYFYRTYRNQVLFSIILELDFFINNAFYLNKFFFKNTGVRRLINNKPQFDYNFFFLKIKLFNQILWKFLNQRRQVKIWKTLLFFFFTSVGSIINKSIFLQFNFFIKFDNFNTINYFEFNKFLFFKVDKQASNFSLFYFFLFLYKPYYVNKFSLFTVSSYKNIGFEIFSFFNFIELKSKTKSNYSNWIIV